jgi:hypothetical protein
MAWRPNSPKSLAIGARHSIVPVVVIPPVKSTVFHRIVLRPECVTFQGIARRPHPMELFPLVRAPSQSSRGRELRASEILLYTKGFAR